MASMASMASSVRSGASVDGDDDTGAMDTRTRRERNAAAAAAAAAALELQEHVRAARAALELDTDMTINMTDKPIGDDAVGELAPLIGRCQKLTKVIFKNCGVTDQGAMYLTHALGNNQSVANIVLSDNQITAGAARHLAELAANSEVLNRVTLAQTELVVDELAGRCSGRRGRHLKYEQVPLHPLDYVMIGEMMKWNRRTESLEFRGCPMSDLDISWINGMLQVNKTLRRLTLCAGTLGEPGVRTLLEAVSASRLELLDVQAAPIHPSSAAALCSCLSKNKTLKTLHLYWNHLGDAGMAALCATLMKDPQPALSTLVVYNNDLTSVGAFAVAEMLKRNTVIHSLALVSNKLGEEGCAALCEAVAINTTLVRLDLSKCHLGWDVTELAVVFRENRTLTAVNVSGNLLNPEEAAHLAIALRGNRVLRTLALSVISLPVQELMGTAKPPREALSFASMELSTVDAMFIAKCLRVNNMLTSLDLSGNFLRDDAAMAIARNLHHNDTLLRLKLTSTFWIPVQDVRSRVCEVPELRFPKAGLERLDFLVVGELLRKNQCMEILDLRGNDMHQVHGIQCLAPALAINESLTELHFVWNTFGPEGMEVLADAIVGRNHLRHLTLRAVGVGPGKGALALGRIVASSTSLTRLECVLNSLSHGGTRALTDALLLNNSITSMDLKNNIMGDEGAAELARALARQSPLTELNLRENKIESEGLYALAEGLESDQCPLQVLNLSYNKFGESGAHSLAEMLRLNSVLRSLNVNATKLRSEGAAAIGAMLRVNRTLEFLSISCKTVGTAGALAIARALKYNRKLSQVQLGVCKLPVQDMLGSTSQQRILLNDSHLTDMDTGFVAECLRSNRVCTYLDVSGNKISNHAVDVLNDALQHNVVLRTLKLDELELAVQDLFGSTGANAISFAGQFLSNRDSVFIAATLKVNTPMSTLDLTDCNIGPAACQHLGEAFSLNGAITTLKLGHNNFGSVGAIALAPVLRADNVLQVLDLAGNEVGQDGATALAEAVRHNWVISLIRFESMPLPVQDLRGSEDVTSIDYSYSGLTWYDVIFITEVLKHNQHVKDLDLSGNDLHNTSARCVALLGKENRFIRSIRLLDNDFNSVVGHIFADNLSGNRVVVNLELDETAMSVRTKKELKRLIKLNRRFVGEFDNGRLLRGEQRFMNGDVLAFEGEESLQGYEARGVYHVSTNPKPEVALLSMAMLATLAEVGFTIAAVAALFSLEEPEVVLGVIIALVLSVVTLYSAHVVQLLGRPEAAWLQLVSLLTIKDAMDALHYKCIRGVTMDIRSETPIFSFVPVARLRTLEGMWRGGVNAFMLTALCLAGGEAAGSWMIVAGAVACLFSMWTGMVLADLHFVREGSWNKKVEAVSDWEDAAWEQQTAAAAKQRARAEAEAAAAADGVTPVAPAGGAGTGAGAGAAPPPLPVPAPLAKADSDRSVGKIQRQRSAANLSRRQIMSQRRLAHPWLAGQTLSVLLFRLLEVLGRVASIGVMVHLWGGVIAVVLVLEGALMVPYWSWGGDKLMEDMKGSLTTLLRWVYSLAVFPGFGDIAPMWVVGTDRLPPLYHLLVRGAGDLIIGLLLLGTGMGNAEGVSDAVVGITGAILLMKLPATYWYYKEMSAVAEEHEPVDYTGMDLLDSLGRPTNGPFGFGTRPLSRPDDLSASGGRDGAMVARPTDAHGRALVAAVNTSDRDPRAGAKLQGFSSLRVRSGETPTATVVHRGKRYSQEGLVDSSSAKRNPLGIDARPVTADSVPAGPPTPLPGSTSSHLLDDEPGAIGYGEVTVSSFYSVRGADATQTMMADVGDAKATAPAPSLHDRPPRRASGSRTPPRGESRRHLLSAAPGYGSAEQESFQHTLEAMRANDSAASGGIRGVNRGGRLAPLS